MNQTFPLKLSDLAAQIQEVISETFYQEPFWVVADVTNHTFYTKKSHHYFDLVEKHPQTHNIVAKMSAVAWNEGHLRICHFQQQTGQTFRNDIHVLLKVQVEFHPAYGLKLVIKDIDTSFTLGLLEQQRQQVLLQLVDQCSEYIEFSDGIFITRNSQLVLPQVIQKVAVISSNHSAGYEDFMHSVGANPFGYQFHISNYFAAMQGEHRAYEIRDRLLEIEHSRQPFDVVVIVRGGGAQTDFLIFDTFILGEIVARFPIPIITGIGHQKNQTIIDMMAHTSAKTPTKVAELLIENNRIFETQVVELKSALFSYVQRLMSRASASQALTCHSLVRTLQQTLNKYQNELNSYKEIVARSAKKKTFASQIALMQLGHGILFLQKLSVIQRQSLLRLAKAGLIKSLDANFNLARQKILHQSSFNRAWQQQNLYKKGWVQLTLPDGRKVLDKNLTVGNQIKIHTSSNEVLTEIIFTQQKNADNQ